MRPQFNPRHVNQNSGNRPLQPQQIMGNPGNFDHKPIHTMPQFQLGMLNNPQLPMQSFSNQNAHLPPSQLFPFQQASMQNPNNINNCLQRMLPFNAMNPAQFLPNGQNMQNLVQTMNQLMQMQMQVQMQMANCGSQNPAFLPNMQLGMNNGNGSTQGNTNAAKSQSNVGARTGFNMLEQFVPNGHINVPNMNQILPMQMPLCGPLNPSHLPNMQTGSLNCNGVMQLLQNNVGGVNEVNKLENSWNKSHNNSNNSTFSKSDVSHIGFNKKQSHHKQSTNFKSDCDSRVKVQENPIQEGKKRAVVLNYSAKEIQEWREARRKNHPSKFNKEGVKEKAADGDNGDIKNKARRQQLKEILAKQAELGIEVAEIPASYLSDSERRVNGRGANRRGGKFQNKFDKRGTFRQKERFPKRQRPVNHDPSNSENQRVNKRQRHSRGKSTDIYMDDDNKSEPSLLKKLVSSDLEIDDKHLLHAFKFMEMNSFFKDWPDKPLKFPQVIVRDSGNGNSNTSIETNEYFSGSVLECSGDKSEEEDGEILE